MRVLREDLLKELESIEAGLSPREIIEQSSCFVFEEGKVRTFNDEIACTQSTSLKIEGAILADPLLAILRKLTEETLEMSVTQEHLVIRGKNKKCRIRMDVEILLPTDAIEPPKKWKKLPPDFAEAVNLVKECAGRDETQFETTCVHITPKWIEAFDNIQMARYLCPIPIEVPTLVRRDSIKHIVAMEMTKFSETENWIHFKNGVGLVLSCRRVVGGYPKLSKILKVEGKEITFPKSLPEELERAEVFSSDTSEEDRIKVTIIPGKMQIKAEGGCGDYTATKRVKYKGPTKKFSMSPAILSEVARCHKTCIISDEKLKATLGKFSYVTALE